MIRFEMGRKAPSKWMLALCVALGMIGCGGETPAPDSGPGVDAGGSVDSGPITTDSGMRDSGTADTGTGQCGNGALDTGEDCDGTMLGTATCASQGYGGGTLACASDCTFDESGCDSCGDGTIDTADGEVCDGIELGGATCATRGHVDGTLGCASDCTFDESLCTDCGDGSIDAGEECDGSDLGTATCASRGFSTGTLACDSSCGFDESGCVAAGCGNGVRDASEACDGSDLGGATCNGLGYFGGTLACAGDCSHEVSGCTNCGNGTLEGSEECDGSELGGQSCSSLGFTTGTLACATGCRFNTSGCSTAACGNGTIESGEACDDGNTNAGDGCTSCAVDTGFSCTGAPSSCSAICGNGMIHGGEECDGTNFGGATCASLGYDSGTLSCTASCTRNVSACVSRCGNGTLDTGEECDDGNRVSFDGCSATCQVDPTFDLPVRLRGGEGSNHGRVEVRYGGVWREVCDDIYTTAALQGFANTVCGQLGYTGTGHTTILNFGGAGSPLMDDVVCTGTEPNLSQCQFRGWNRHDCGPSESVGVRCVPGEGDVRLVDGPSGMEGRLQIYHSGAWGEVCDDYWSTDRTPGTQARYNTDTVCQQLGYSDGYFLSSYDAPSGTFILDDVRCTGSEYRIADCPHLAYGTENCFATEGTGVRCITHGEGSHRLVEGTRRNSGRVEVLHNSVWGTVCDDYLYTGDTGGDNFVQVGCEWLGYGGTGSLLRTTGVPDGVDPIFLDDVMCTGAETRISSCPNRGWGVHNCSHYEDVGLTCTP